MKSKAIATLVRYGIGILIGLAIGETWKLKTSETKDQTQGYFHISNSIRSCPTITLQQSNETALDAMQRLPESGGCLVFGDWDQPARFPVMDLSGFRDVQIFGSGGLIYDIPN